MKKGLELIKELESQIEYSYSIQKNRDQRIANNETDIDDCFLSINATSESIQLKKAKIEILKKGGTSIFERISDLEGNIIENSRIIDGKYGECWLVDGIFVSIPSAGCKAGKQVWINAGFKNHADAHNQLCEEMNTDEYHERNQLYYDLSCKAKSLGMEAKGYRVVEVEKPAWVTMKSGNSILHSYPCIFESDFNYFTGN